MNPCNFIDKGSLRANHRQNHKNEHKSSHELSNRVSNQGCKVNRLKIWSYLAIEDNLSQGNS